MGLRLGGFGLMLLLTLVAFWDFGDVLVSWGACLSGFGRFLTGLIVVGLLCCV